MDNHIKKPSHIIVTDENVLKGLVTIKAISGTTVQEFYLTISQAIGFSEILKERSQEFKTIYDKWTMK